MRELGYRSFIVTAIYPEMLRTTSSWSDRIVVVSLLDFFQKLLRALRVINYVRLQALYNLQEVQGPLSPCGLT